MIPMSDFVQERAEAFDDVVKQIYEEINDRYGTDIQLPTSGQDND